MERDLHPRAPFLLHVHIIRVDAPEDSLVSHDDDVFTPLKLHYDRLETDDNIAVALPATITVIVLVVIASFEVLGVRVLDFLVCEAIADARVKLVERLPFQFLEFADWSGEEAGGLDGAFEGGSPDCKYGTRCDGLGDEVREGACVGVTTGRDVGIPTNLSFEVVF
jgi:hypothetical protein